MTTAARLDRLILIPAIILPGGSGLVARGRFRPGEWCGSNDPEECSDRTIGRRMWDRVAAPPRTAVVQATLASVPKW